MPRTNRCKHIQVTRRYSCLVCVSALPHDPTLDWSLAVMQRMAKQTAAAQKRAEAEARKKAKLANSSAAASSQVDSDSSQAAAAGSNANNDTFKEVESASGEILPQAGPSTAGQSVDGPKAEVQHAGIRQEKCLATAGSNKPQPPVGSSGSEMTKPSAAAASSGLHDENQASNGVLSDGGGQTVAGAQSEGGQAGSGKPRAGKKRAAEAHGVGEGTRAGQSRSTRSRTGMCPCMQPCLASPDCTLYTHKKPNITKKGVHQTWGRM